MSRFWSTFWTVAGFLFLIGWLQGIIDIILGLFGVLDIVAPQISEWVHRIGWAVVPIWGALTWIDWKWGWKPENAGLRTTSAAVFWLLPGLLVGALAAGLAHLVEGMLNGGTIGVAPSLPVSTLALVVLVAGQLFGSELVYRGVLISRIQYDLSGRDLLILAIGMPFVWTLAQQVIGQMINLIPFTWITGAGTAALSVFLSLLFLRTDSVWLGAGMRIGLMLAASLVGLKAGDPAAVGARGTGTGMLIVFGIPALILLLMEINKLGNIRRPGPRGGRQRVVQSKTVRGPWGPH